MHRKKQRMISEPISPGLSLGQVLQCRGGEIGEELSFWKIACQQYHERNGYQRRDICIELALRRSDIFFGRELGNRTRI